MFEVILGINNYSYVTSYLVTLDLSFYMILYSSSPAPESTSEHSKIQNFLGGMPHTSYRWWAKGQVPWLVSMSRYATAVDSATHVLLLASPTYYISLV